MPTYDYACDACGHTFELFQSITAAPEKKCPACGKRKLRRLIGIGAAVLVGGRSSSSGGGEGDSGPTSESSSDSGSSSESDSSSGSGADGASSDSKTGGGEAGGERKISGSTSTPTHEAREGRGVGNLVDAARRQRRESDPKPAKSAKDAKPAKPKNASKSTKASKNKTTTSGGRTSAGKAKKKRGGRS